MKHLFILSKFSKKAIFVTFCFLLLPSSMLSAKATWQEKQPQQNNLSESKVTLLAQANNIPESDSTDTAKTRIKQTASDDLDVANSKNQQQFKLEFNRSPIVGNRLRLRGRYSESRLGFTRPRGWNVGKAQVNLRFQHSPALYANRSSLTVLVNDTSIGSIPLNKKQSQVGTTSLAINPKLLQDYNEIKVVAQQNDSEGCSDPNSPNLWTEILPDSAVVFNYQRQEIPLSFSRYPYPIFDNLGLETNEVVYLQPTQATQTWLTSAARFQASLGRMADFRPMETRAVADLADVKPSEKVVIIGTPAEQPAIAAFKKELPLTLNGNQILDQNQRPIPEDTGVLILSKTKPQSGAPVLIITGNSPRGVANASRYLTQLGSRKLGTGQVVLVPKVNEVPTLAPRQWSRYLPEVNNFALSDIKTQADGKQFNDVTVRGGGAPAIEIDFRALPDDRFLRGSSMNLVYSYGPQINPRTSAVEVLIDDTFIGGARLDSEAGENRKNLKVDLPANLIKPDSKLKVYFRMNPREPFDKQNCVTPPDQQLSGTLHADTSFDLKRETSVQLPDLDKLRFGFPFAAPQDLSKTSIVLSQNPSSTDIVTMLEFSERLGRLSQRNTNDGDSVKLNVYTPESLPQASRDGDNLVVIGTREKLPFANEVFKAGGLNLGGAFLRANADTAVQTPQDGQGMIKQILSPWNGERVVLALTAQTENGLDKVRQVLNADPWFFQLKEDTVLISSDKKDPKGYDPDAFQLAFFQSSPRSNRVENTTPLSKASRMIQDNWLLLPAGIVGVSLLLYGIVQLYLKRAATDRR
jgi:cellulose synthase operon protein B